MKRVRDKAKQRKYSATYRGKNRIKINAGNRLSMVPALRRALRLKQRYGLTPEQFAEMEEAQSKRCAICDKPAKLYVDHHQASGVVRALLCRDCNLGLGYFKEDSDALTHAAAYLRRWQEEVLHVAQTRRRANPQLSLWTEECR